MHLQLNRVLYRHRTHWQPGRLLRLRLKSCRGPAAAARASARSLPAGRSAHELHLEEREYEELSSESPELLRLSIITGALRPGECWAARVVRRRPRGVSIPCPPPSPLPGEFGAPSQPGDGARSRGRQVTVDQGDVPARDGARLLSQARPTHNRCAVRGVRRRRASARPARPGLCGRVAVASVRATCLPRGRAHWRRRRMGVSPLPMPAAASSSKCQPV